MDSVVSGRDNDGNTDALDFVALFWGYFFKNP